MRAACALGGGGENECWCGEQAGKRSKMAHFNFHFFLLVVTIDESVDKN